MYVKFTHLFFALIACFSLVGEVEAMSRKAPNGDALYYSCHAEAGPKAKDALCNAVLDYLTKQGHQATLKSGKISDGLLLEFFLDDLQKHSISGRLVWSRCSAGVCRDRTESPQLETSVMDAVVSSQSYDNLVHSLFIVTKPPLDAP